MNAVSPDESQLNVSIWAAGTILLFAGLANCAVAKGHRAWWGATAIFSVIGAIIIYTLPDEHPAI